MNISSEKINDKPNADTSPVEKQDGVKKTPEDAAKEPLVPVPVVDDIKPPLEVTLGGGDVVVVPSEKK